MMLPDVQSQRIFTVSMPFSIDSLAEVMRKLYPQRKIGAEPNDTKEVGEDRTVFKEAGRAEELLKRMGRKGWVEIETSVERTCSAFPS